MSTEDPGRPEKPVLTIRASSGVDLTEAVEALAGEFTVEQDPHGLQKGGPDFLGVVMAIEGAANLALTAYQIKAARRAATEKIQPQASVTVEARAGDYSMTVTGPSGSKELGMLIDRFPTTGG